MIRWRRTEQLQTILVHDEVTCDRCGEVMPRLSGVGRMRGNDFPYRGGVFTGRIFPTQNLADMRVVDAELCAACLDDFMEFVGLGIRVQTESEAAKFLEVEDA